MKDGIGLILAQGAVSCLLLPLLTVALKVADLQGAMQAKPTALLQKFAVLWSLEDFEVLCEKKKIEAMNAK